MSQWFLTIENQWKSCQSSVNQVSRIKLLMRQWWWWSDKYHCYICLIRSDFAEMQTVFHNRINRKTLNKKIKQFSPAKVNNFRKCFLLLPFAFHSCWCFHMTTTSFFCTHSTLHYYSSWSSQSGSSIFRFWFIFRYQFVRDK